MKPGFVRVRTEGSEKVLAVAYKKGNQLAIVMVLINLILSDNYRNIEENLLVENLGKSYKQNFGRVKVLSLSLSMEKFSRSLRSQKQGQ